MLTSVTCILQSLQTSFLSYRIHKIELTSDLEVEVAQIETHVGFFVDTPMVSISNS